MSTNPSRELYEQGHLVNLPGFKRPEQSWQSLPFFYFLMNVFQWLLLQLEQAFLSLKIRMLIGFLISVVSVAQAQVSGRVFQDYNANGVYDTNKTITASDGLTLPVAVDKGVAGVVVTAYNTAGGVAGTANTAADGTYTITGLSGSVRIQFSGFPADYLSGPVGTNSGTTVQFATAPATNINLGINRSWDYSEDNPDLVTNCYVPLSNSGTYSTNDVLVSVPNSAGSTVYSNGIVCSSCPTGFDLPAPSHLATHAQVGSTFGLGWQRSSKTLFAATYIKQFSDIGPQGTGAIYRIDMSDPANPVVKTGTPNTANGPIDLNLIFGANTCGSNPFSPYPDYGTESGRQQVGDAVFNAGFADIDVSEDGNTLYALSFSDKKLYSIPIDGSPINSTTVKAITVPVIDSPGLSLSTIRPTGMGLKDGKVYVVIQGSFDINQDFTYDRGVTVGNSWETARYMYNGYSASGPPSGPTTAVYVYDPATNSFTTTPVLSFRHWDNAGLRVFSLATIYADLVFDEMGAMILSGRYMKDDITGGIAGSRLLRACNDGTGNYVLEGPGGCGGITTNGSSSTSGTSIGTYYYQTVPTDGQAADGNGGLVHLPGHPYIIETQYDPYRLYSAGLRWLDNTTGQSLKSLEIVATQSPISFPGVEWSNKSGILGKLVPLLSSAPIEIGNRVWADTDKDGIQDADETGIAGVSVSLCTEAGTLIATATTDASGTYYFSSTNATSTTSAVYSLTGLTANTTYQLKFPTTASGKVLTAANVGDDNTDSDASTAGVVSFSTASFGANDHTFDVGYSLAPCSLTATATPTVCNSATNQYSVSGTISLTGTAGGTATVTDGATSMTVAVAASATMVAYSLSGLSSGTGSHTVTVTLSGCGTAVMTYTAPASCVSCACPANLLQGSSFDTGTDLTAWTIKTDDPSGNILFGQDTPYAVCGTYYGYIRSANADSYYASIYQNVNTTAGTLFNLSVYAGVHDAAQDSQIRLEFFNASNTLLAGGQTVQVDNVVDVSGGLIPYALSGTAPAGTAYVRVTAYTQGTYNGVGMHLKFDNFCLTQTLVVCSLTATATPTACNTATNQYSVSGTISLSNTAGGVATITDGAKSSTVSVGVSATSVAYSLSGLTSGTGSHTVVVSLPDCGTAVVTYSAPASCTVAPPCTLAITATPSACNPATNKFDLTGQITFTNAPTAGILRVRIPGKGYQDFTAPFTSPLSYSIAGLNSNALKDTVEAMFSNGVCKATAIYTAPALCLPSVCVSPQTGGVQSFSYAVPLSRTNWTQALTIPKFDDLGGTRVLKNVLFTVDQTIQNWGVAESTDASDTELNIETTGTTSFTLNGTALTTNVFAATNYPKSVAAGILVPAMGSWPGDATTTTPPSTLFAMTFINTDLNNQVDPTLSPNWVTNLTGNPGDDDDIAYFSPVYSEGSKCILYSNATDLANFTGTGNLDLTANAKANGFVSGSGNVNSIIKTSASALVTVTYIYCDVPAVCSLTATATPGVCNSATNQYSVSGTISLTGTAGGTATVTDGATSTTVAVAASATSVAYSLTGLTSGTGSHTVTVSLPGCGTVTATYTAPASCTVAASILVTSATVCYGSSATLVASGCTGTVSWNTGATGASLVTPTLTTTTSYTATCTTGTGSTTTAVGTVTVMDQALLSLQASSTLVTVGTPVSLSAIGCTGTIAWSTGDNGATISVTPANATNVYSATCTTGPGCTATASLTITTAPSASLIVVSATVCYGSSATLVASGCTGTVSWNTGDTGNSLLTPTLTAATNYTATCTTGTGSTTTAVGTVTVMPEALLSLGASSTLVTVGSPVSLSAIGCTGTVAWSTGGSGATISVTPANATNVYSATCTTGPGCTKAASITVNTAVACSLSLVATPGLCASVTNSYSVTGTIQLTNNTAGGTVTITDGLQLSSVSIASGATSVTFSLTGLLSDGFVHSLSATLSGCGTSSTTYTAPASCTYTCPAPVHVCKGSSYAIGLSAPTGQLSYQWYRNGVAITGATTSSYTATQAGSYSVVVNGNVVGQCPDGSCCPVVIVEDSVAIYQATAQAPSCNTVTSSVANSDGGIVVSQWQQSAVDTAHYYYQVSLGGSFNGSQLVAGGASSLVPGNGVLVSNLANPSTVSGQSYTVRITNGLGCFRDVVVTLAQTVCSCPPTKCLPFVVRRIR